MGRGMGEALRGFCGDGQNVNPGCSEALSIRFSEASGIPDECIARVRDSRTTVASIDFGCD